MEIFIRSRFVTALLSVLGGYFVFRWARDLFGEKGALISLGLWILCPNILAHGGLVTPDVGSTVLGFVATYCFWRYLKAPSLGGAVAAGLLLGATEASKFTFVLLPPIWITLVLIKLWGDRRKRPAAERPSQADEESLLSWKRVLGHAAVLLLVSLTTLNAVYLFEGTGQPLGEFDFRSRALTREVETTEFEGQSVMRLNRFRGTFLSRVPVPLPEHYVLGMDDQRWETDFRPSPKYLRGEVRSASEEGWWYYYLYGLLVKVPLGTLAVLLMAVGAILFNRCRRDALTEMTLALPVLVFLAVLSTQTEMNKHLRYVLPIFPFAFVWAGRLATVGIRHSGVVVTLLIAANAASVLRVHPHYLAYFNEAAGGPESGWRHLGASNTDWGQGLVALKEWLDKHASGQRVYLAYTGFVDPNIFGIDHDSPPSSGPVPGIHAVGVNYLIGISRQAHRPEALMYYREFEPIAMPGYCMYVYDIDREEANRVRRKLGLSLLK